MSVTRFLCDCTDPGCPAHGGVSQCRTAAAVRLRRVDWGIDAGYLRMCQACADDAMESGVFALLLTQAPAGDDLDGPLVNLDDGRDAVIFPRRHRPKPG